MATQAQQAGTTATRPRTLGQQPWWLLPAAMGGLILLGFALYLMVLLKQIETELATLPQVRQLLTNANNRMERVSGQLDEVNTDAKHLTPLMGQINLNATHVLSRLASANSILQETTPTLRRMDRHLTTTDQHMVTMQRKLEALQVPIGQMATTTGRLRKFLPR